MTSRGPQPEAIIVGSGPAGVNAAWPLVRAGIEVLMLDASTSDPAPSPLHDHMAAFRAHSGRWRARFGADLGGLAVGTDQSPKFSTPLARSVLPGFAVALGLETQGFAAAGSLARGGLSTIWGALAAAFTSAELADFPFPAEALQGAYAAVRSRIGVSGGANGGPDALASRSAQRLLRRHRQRPAPPGFSLQPAPNAVLEADTADRQGCVRCGLCLYGCARGSIYNAADELPALQRYPNFQYRPGHRVLSLGRAGRPDLQVQTALGVQTLSASVVMLAAGAIATTGLVLDRLGWTDRPVRLLSNPAAAAAFLIPGLIGEDLPAQSVSLGQLVYRLTDTEAVGVLYGADALPLDLFAQRMPLSRPVALRLAHALAPALVMATVYMPGALSQNSLTLHADGPSRMTIRGERTPAAEQALRLTVKTLSKRLGSLGAVHLPGSTTLLEPGADAHYGGTLPMGGAGPVATSPLGELSGAPGVFVVDGAALPSLPATHPTLTIMANATRIAESVAQRLRAGGTMQTSRAAS